MGDKKGNGVCYWCAEPILPGEVVQQFQSFQCSPMHKECAYRSIVGSVGHLKKQCECFGGHEGDPPGMSRREQAKAAVAEWNRQFGAPQNNQKR